MIKTKNIFCFLIAALCLTFCFSLPVAAEAPEVNGGTHTVTFESSDRHDFDLYAEFKQPMYMLDGKLFAPTLCESKAIYRGGTFSDVQVEVDISSINPGGKIDAGIYVQARDPGNNLDAITAWDVQVERIVGNKTYTVKLHEFKNGKYMGERKVAEYVPCFSDTVHLKVTVQGGTLSAYTDFNGRLFSYEIGAGSGSVGLRCFYAPNYFENFTVTSPAIQVETAALASKLAELESFDYAPYTAESADALNGGVSQNAVDTALCNIEKAQNALTKTVTQKELDELVLRAREIVANGSRYTKNTVASISVVLNRIENADDDLSTLYKLLKRRVDGAVEYKFKKGASGNE